MRKGKGNKMARKKKIETAEIEAVEVMEEPKEKEPETSVVKFGGKEYTVAHVAGNTVRLTDGENEICVAVSAIEFE